MEKWLGIITGTNKAIVSLDFEKDSQNSIKGTFNVYDVDLTNLAGRIEGGIINGVLKGNLLDFKPVGEGLPKTGQIDFDGYDSGKELKGQWSTDAGTQGECILYNISKASKNSPNPQQPVDSALTLETKDSTITFCTLKKKHIEELFMLMARITDAMREKKKAHVLPPIYSIVYDQEERIRTYSWSEFLQKLNNAEKIWYVGFEFKDEKDDIKKITINLSHQEQFNLNTRCCVIVESTDKEVVLFVPEVVRGLISKRKNKNAFFHHWLFEASIQLSAVITMFLLSYQISNRLAIPFQKYNISIEKPYVFLIAFFIFSNLWTYGSRMMLNFFYRRFPVVDLVTRERVFLSKEVVVGLLVTFFAWLVTSSWSLISTWLFK